LGKLTIKKNVTSNEPIENVNEQMTLDEPVIKNNQPSISKNPSPVNFDFTDEAAHEDDMGPVRDILSAGQPEEEEEIGFDIPLLTVEEVAAFLKGTYDVQGWFTYPELWKREDQFFYEIASGILPQINAWAARVPAVAHAVKTVSAAGSWGRLIWDIAGTWFMVSRRRQLEAQKKLEEGENKQNAGYTVNYSNQQQQQQPVTNTTNLGTKPGYIIP
jgi:hypothetical protein